MLDREDLIFATCHQLAGEIESDWDQDMPVVVQASLVVLHTIDEPETVSDNKVVIMAALHAVAETFKVVMAHSDAWRGPNSGMLKKEIVMRVKDYESRYKELASPVLGNCSIELHA